MCDDNAKQETTTTFCARKSKPAGLPCLASLSNRLFVRRRFELTRLAMVTDERL
jgi:hypothetical protein